MTDALRNAVWHSLVGPQSDHAEGTGLARRFHPDVSVFYAIDEPTADAWHDLAALSDGRVVVLFREAPLPSPPAGWECVFQGDGYQMVRDTPSGVMPPLPATDPKTGQRVSQRALVGGDVDAMLDLVARTEPGPFRPRTVELGGYLGIFHDDTLVAMAGRRFHLPGYVEVERGLHRSRCPPPRLRSHRHRAGCRSDRGRGQHADASRRADQRLGSLRLRAARFHDQPVV